MGGAVYVSPYEYMDTSYFLVTVLFVSSQEKKALDLALQFFLLATRILYSTIVHFLLAILQKLLSVDFLLLLLARRLYSERCLTFLLISDSCL